MTYKKGTTTHRKLPASIQIGPSEYKCTPTYADMLAAGWTYEEPPQPVAYQPTAEDIISQLWHNATAKEQSGISNSALSMLTVGVLQGLPKSKAVEAWIGSIWTEYYQRKAQVLAGNLSVEMSFDALPDIPYSVPELREETGK